MKLFELLKQYMPVEEMPGFANSQGVAGLLYDEVLQMYEESGVNPLDRRSLMRLAGYTQKRQEIYHSFKESMERLARFYQKHGIGMMVLKGYGLSLDWPVPDHRPSGDLDVWLFELREEGLKLKEEGLKLKEESGELREEGLKVRDDDVQDSLSSKLNSLSTKVPTWKRADELIEKAGIKVDDSHEHHTCFRVRDISVENHYDFNNVKLHRDAMEWERMFKKLAEEQAEEVRAESLKLKEERLKLKEEGGELKEESLEVRAERLKLKAERLKLREDEAQDSLSSKLSSLSSKNIYLPSGNLHALFLMRHMGLHFASTEMNLRQVCDWGFFVEKHSDEVDWTMVVEFLDKMKNLKFFHQINAICVDYLGFDESRFPSIMRDEALEKRILDDVFRPEFTEENPKGNAVQQILFKNRRYWKNGWKRKLIFRDSPIVDFFYGCVAHLKRWDTIGE